VSFPLEPNYANREIMILPSVFHSKNGEVTMQ
jgi:hypothetical protein